LIDKSPILFLQEREILRQNLVKKIKLKDQTDIFFQYLSIPILTAINEDYYENVIDKDIRQFLQNL
jgi:hypothetical protein